MLQKMSTWDGAGIERLQKNADAADRVFAMLLCARVFVLKQLLDCISPLTDVVTARRRWVLVQSMPPRLGILPADDLFVEVVRILRAAETEDLLDWVRSTTRGFAGGEKAFFLTNYLS
jgi:hypothetical protein